MTEESKVRTADVMSLLDMIAHGVVTVQLAKDVLVAMAAEGKSPDKIISEVAMKRPAPTDDHVALVRALIDSICDQANLAGHGPPTKDAIIKTVMRYTAGKANPLAIQVVLKEKGL